jgi:hypothetical protein
MHAKALYRFALIAAIALALLARARALKGRRIW